MERQEVCYLRGGAVRRCLVALWNSGNCLYLGLYFCMLLFIVQLPCPVSLFIEHSEVNEQEDVVIITFAAYRHYCITHPKANFLSGFISM